MKRPQGRTNHQKNYEKAILLAWMYGAFCALCGNPVAVWTYGQDDPAAATLDHIVFRALGGTKTLENLQLAHRLCNTRRHPPPIPSGSPKRLPPDQRPVVERRRAAGLRAARKPLRPSVTGPWLCAKCGRGAGSRIEAFRCCEYGWRQA